MLSQLSPHPAIAQITLSWAKHLVFHEVRFTAFVLYNPGVYIWFVTAVLDLTYCAVQSRQKLHNTHISTMSLGTNYSYYIENGFYIYDSSIHDSLIGPN
jgi:hypothetical protein